MSDVTPRSRSLFQVSVVAAIIVLLAAVLLNAVYYVQEKAERTVIEATVLNIEKGLEIEVRTREIRGQASSIRDLVGVNPVSFLAKPPEGYAEKFQPNRRAARQAAVEAAKAASGHRIITISNGGKPAIRTM